METYKNLIFIILVGLSFSVFAESSHHKHSSESVVINNFSNEESSGVALSIAKSQHQFDFGTYSWQGAIGVGSFNGTSAISFGMGKRLNKDRMLINGSIGTENGKTGVGIGANWRF